MKWSKYGDDVLPAWVADNLVQGLYLAVHAFTEPGEGVIVQTPIYPPFLTSVTALGRRVMDALALDG
ncbi:MAG: hypothetical protein HY355_02735 [Armatimonadetes bacterium]|nr:hypothetical protein [Armatimonadota bacterium]